MKGITQELLEFVAVTNYEALPKEMIHETKRLMLDCIGDALAALNTDKGRYGVEMARRFGGSPEARILGSHECFSFGSSAFANGELITAMDWEPYAGIANHFPPFIVPACLALSENKGVSGKDVVLAVALGSEISIRLLKAIRGTKRYFTSAEGSEVGKIIGTKQMVSVIPTPLIAGALAAGKLMRLDALKMSNLIGLAAHFLPIPQAKRWDVPVWPLIKWGSGWASLAEIASVLMADIGYTADTEPLDGEMGLWRFHGSDKWNPEVLTNDLGKIWTLLEVLEYKPYPVFRPAHIALDCFIKIIEKNKLNPDDILTVKIQTNPVVAQSYNSNKKFENNVETQSSIPYVIAAAAYRINPADWQNVGNYKNPKLLNFLDRVVVEPHPEFSKISLDWSKKQGSTATLVQVITKDKTFTEEGEYARGCPYPESARMSDDDLIEKFKTNAHSILRSKMEKAVVKIMDMEKISIFSEIMDEVTLSKV